MTARVAVHVASARIWRIKNHSVRTRLRDTSTPVAGVRRLLVNAGQQGVRFDVGDEAVTVGAFKSSGSERRRGQCLPWCVNR
jgi:hypothetical protein